MSMLHPRRSAAGVLVALASALLSGCGDGATTNSADGAVPASNLTLDKIPFHGQRAYEHLTAICQLGGRVSGSKGMASQQEMLTEHFKKLGGQVELQKFRYTIPSQAKEVALANLIVTWHPERTERILLCAHYDTRPYPDQDPVNPRGLFVGANDGASGVAVLMELGRAMPELHGKYGVDFVFFDAEELVFDDRRDHYFVGSEYFSRDYVAKPPKHKYRWGVLLDMVGDANLQVYQERFSVTWPDTRPLVQDIWNTAKKLGVVEFVARPKYEIRDDHMRLRGVAKIPTCDIIDFDYDSPRGYSYWHTTEDTADKCSALSLAKVGWVVQEWLVAEAAGK